MTMGAALLLVAVGAILRFAVATVSTHGIDLHTIGDILMGVGVVGLLLWLIVWVPRTRGRRNNDGYPPPPAGPPQEPRDWADTPDAYRPGRYSYPPGDRYESPPRTDAGAPTEPVDRTSRR